MALPRSFSRLARLALSPGRPTIQVARASRGCTPSELPPCPPCKPKPRPCCRGRPTEKVLAETITCCPPPQGQRPPCPAPKPACSLNCSNAKPLKENARSPCQIGSLPGQTKPPCQQSKSSGNLEQPRRNFSQSVPSKPSECHKSPLGCIKHAEECRTQTSKPPEECTKPPKCEKKPVDTRLNAPCSQRPVKCLEAPREGETRLEKCEKTAPCPTTQECFEVPAECVHCEQVTNYVTRRLEAARRARRADYLREVCERIPPKMPCTEPYKLRGSTECVHATDGRKYIVKEPSSRPASSACGPCREPPEPCCVELLPDNKCQPKKAVYVDPCAHRPKKVISISRPKPENHQSSGATNQNQHHSNSTSSPASTRPPAVSGKPAATTATAKICAIMKSLTGGSKTEKSPRNKGAAKCSQTTNVPPQAAKQDSTKEKCTKTSQSRGPKAGDNSWCNDLKKPPAVDPRCRPLGEEERIRRRPCPHIKCGPRAAGRRKPGKRCFHTAAKSWSKSKSDQSKVESMLRQRASLKRSAQGRVVDIKDKCEKPPPPAQPTCAALELPVPPGAAAVSVSVSVNPKSTCVPPEKPQPGVKDKKNDSSKDDDTCSLSRSATQKEDAACVSRAGAVCGSRSSDAKKEGSSWMSLKNLQKKIQGRSKKAESTDKNKAKATSSKPPDAPTSSVPLPKVQQKQLYKSTPYPKPNPVCKSTARATSTQDLTFSKGKDSSSASENPKNPCAPENNDSWIPCSPEVPKPDSSPSTLPPKAKSSPCAPQKPKVEKSPPKDKPSPCAPSSEAKSSPSTPPKTKSSTGNPPPKPKSSSCAPPPKSKSSCEKSKPSPKKNKPSCFSILTTVL